MSKPMPARLSRVTAIPLAVLLIAAAGAGVAVPAGAAGPTNGKVAFARDPDGAGDLFTMNPDGTGLAHIGNGENIKFSPTGWTKPVPSGFAVHTAMWTPLWQAKDTRVPVGENLMFSPLPMCARPVP